MKTFLSQNKTLQKSLQTTSLLAGFMFLNGVASPAFAKKSDSFSTLRTQKITQRITTSAPKIPRFFSIRNLLANKKGNSPQAKRTASLSTDNLAALGKETFPFQQAGYRIFNSSQNKNASMWRQLKASWKKDANVIKQCLDKIAKCRDSAKIFTDILKKVEKQPYEKKIKLVNSLVNKNIRYRTDMALFNTRDHWSTPLVSLGWSGDCEDYAIAKYYLLLKAGVEDKNLRLVLITDKKVQEGHAILAVRGKKGEWNLLDNRYDKIERDADMLHYEPFYAFNQETETMFALPYASN